MPVPQRQFGDWPGVAVVGLHGALLLGALAVPLHAVALTLIAALRHVGDSAVPIDTARWGALLANTAAVCVLAVLVAVGLGTVLGLLIARTDLPGRGIWQGAALLGACLPVYIVAVAVFAVIPLFRLSGSLPACGVLYGLVYTPLSVLVLGAAFRTADPELEEQALLDASAGAVLWQVTLRQARWGLGAVALIVTLLVATDFTLTDLLVVRTFAEEVYTQFQLDPQRVGPVLTAVPVLGVLAVVLLIVQARYGAVGGTTPWQADTTPRRLSLGGWRTATAIACGGLAVALVGVPLGGLLVQVGHWRGLGAAIADLAPEVRNSTLLAACGATAVLLPAMGLAWTAVRGGRLTWVVGLALIVLLATPSPVAGISLIALFNRPGPLGGVYDSPVIVVLGYFVRFLPIGVLLLIPAVRRVPLELEQAARLDGCHWFGVQRHVLWPTLRPMWTAAWLIVLILCFGEIGTSVLVVPPKWPLLSVRAFGLLHFGVYRDLAVLTLLASACIVLAWLALLWITRRAFAAGPATRRSG